MVSPRPSVPRRLEKQITAALQKRFPDRTAVSHFRELFMDYIASGLAPPHLGSEIETGDEGKFWSYLWETMLFRHLRSMGYALRNTVRAAGQDGPDFCFDHRGYTIWIEATVPAPEGIPADWLVPAECRVRTKPDQERVLRCTSAIDAKQRQFAEYRAKGIVGTTDCSVIAVNICRLSDWDPDGNGLSQLPLVTEAVLPVGRLGVPITAEGKPAGPAQHVPRFTVTKPNGREIPTGNFLDPRFANVSAVVQGHQKDMLGKNLILSTVHNPLASNRLPINLTGSVKEFVGEDRGDKYEFRNVAPGP